MASPIRRGATTKTITIYTATKKNKNGKRSVPSKKAKVQVASESSRSKVNKATSKLKTKVTGKKATVQVRAPVAHRNTRSNSNRNSELSSNLISDESDQISLSSAKLSLSSSSSSNEEKFKESSKTVQSKARTISKSRPVSKIRIIEETVATNRLTKNLSLSEHLKTKPGRPKKTRKVHERDRVDSPPLLNKKRMGRPVRVPEFFLGGVRLATLANKVFKSPQDSVENSFSSPKTIVLEKSTFDLTKERRKRVSWSDEEVKQLQLGVRNHGEGFWSAILQDQSLDFHPQRTQIDLKDKWRNLVAYVPYEQHRMRRYVLVNSEHQIINSPSGNPHVFNNRWPRDAALKVATRDEFYPFDENGNRPEVILIHLKEIMDERVSSERPPTVYVYRATRILQKSRNIKKFAGYAAVWTGYVEKVAEELLVKAVDIFPTQNTKK